MPVRLADRTEEEIVSVLETFRPSPAILDPKRPTEKDMALELVGLKLKGKSIARLLQGGRKGDDAFDHNVPSLTTRWRREYFVRVQGRTEAAMHGRYTFAALTTRPSMR